MRIFVLAVAMAVAVPAFAQKEYRVGDTKVTTYRVGKRLLVRVGDPDEPDRFLVGIFVEPDTSSCVQRCDPGWLRMTEDETACKKAAPRREQMCRDENLKEAHAEYEQQVDYWKRCRPQPLQQKTRAKSASKKVAKP